MNKKILILFILILNTIFLTGCILYEIEEYSIVAGIAIDYNNNLYKVTYEIYKENNGQTTSLTSVIKEGEGETISEAVNKIDNMIYQIPYLNHCLIIILGENILKNKLNETLNYFLHEVRIRSSCYILSSHNTNANSILKTSQKINQVVSYNLFKKIDQKPSEVSIWKLCAFDYIMNEKASENGVIVIPIVQYDKDFSFETAYIINNENTIYVIDRNEIFIIQLFFNVVKEGIINIENKYLYLKNADSNIKFKNNIIIFNVYMQVLSYDDLGIDLKNNEEKEKAINEFEKQTKSQIVNTFKKYQNNNIDCFGIYKYLERYHLKLYNNIKKNYINYFKKLNIEIKISIDLLTSGLSEERIK